ncbi:MAG: T9SS C-terminal target domain-containing protein [Bacteroidetes bacterium]|nr:MAG: T9SS C-terminal target domain-containing protein [Bacteroidota bacterium]
MYPKTLYTILSFMLAFLSSSAQEWNSFNSSRSNLTGFATSIAADKQGNVITAGIFGGTMDIGNGTSLVGSGLNDAFIAKYSSSHNIIWARKMGGTSNDEAKQVVVDKNGAIYVTGTFVGTATFGSSSVTSRGGIDMFVAKYSKDGVFAWVKAIGGTGTENNPKIAVDSIGSVYITGSFSGSIFLPNSGGLTSSGSQDCFIIKLDASGATTWSTKIGGTNYEVTNDIKVDDNMNVYIGGDFAGSSASIGTFNLTNVGATDGFLAKTNSAGVVTMAIKIASTAVDRVDALALDSNNNIYVSGNHNMGSNFTIGSTIIPNTTDKSIFIAKFAPSGSLLWSSLEGNALPSASFAITVLGNQLIWGGYFTDSLTIGNQFVDGNGVQDAVIASYSLNGSLNWVRSGGGKRYDAIQDLAAGNMDTLLVCGTTADTCYMGTFRSNFAANFGARSFWASMASRTCVPVTQFEQSQIHGGCAGSNATLYIKAGMLGNPVYQWKRNNQIVGYNSKNLQLSNITSQDEGSYTCTIITPCDTVTYAIANFQVIPTQNCNLNPPYVWVKSGGSTQEELKNHKVVIDSAGNSYVAGLFRTTVNFGNGISLVSSGGFDLFFAKYNANGVIQWAKKIGSTGAEELAGLSIDGNANVYISGNCNIGGTTNTTTFDQLTSTIPQYFLVKFNSNGTLKWLKQAPNPFATVSSSTTDKLGNTYTTLSFQTTLLLDTFVLTQATRTALALCKYDSLGNVKYATKISNPTLGGMSCSSIALDSSGKNIYLTGNISGNVGVGGFSHTSTNHQFYLVKCDTDSLRVRWFKKESNGKTCYGNKVHVTQKGNIYVSFIPTDFPLNFSDNIVNFQANSFASAGLVQADSNGVFTWAKGIDGDQGDVINDIASDSLNNVFITGFTGIGANIGGMVSKGGMFVASLNEAGRIQFLKSGTSAEPTAIAVDASNNCYVTGTFKYHVQFDNIYVQGSSQLIDLNDFFITKIGASSFVVPIVNTVISNNNVVGNLIEITGQYLQNTQTVHIGATKAILLSAKSDKVTAMIAPGTVSGGITLGTQLGSNILNRTVTINTAVAPNIQQGSKLTVTNAHASAKLGAAVAISASGNTAVIGAPDDDAGVGSVYVFNRVNHVWQLTTKLTGTYTGSSVNAKQGTAVAISADGTKIAFGAPGNNNNAGGVYIFTKNATSWVQQAYVTPYDMVGSARLGTSITMGANGEIIVAGGMNDNSNRGASWIFVQRDAIWQQLQAKLVATDATTNAQQGSAVAISADTTTIAIGALRDNNYTGAFWIFKRNETGLYTQQGNKYLPTQVIGAAQIGTSIAINADGKSLAIGAPKDNNKGAVWIYVLQNNLYMQDAKITNTNSADNSQFGFAASLSANGKTLLVGSNLANTQNGASWQYTRPSNGWASALPTLIQGSGAVGAAQQGSSVAISADETTSIIGGLNDDTQKGAFWIFYNQNNLVLPVTFFAFTLQQHNTYNQLQFTVGSQHNMLSYIVERSTDGISFTSIQPIQPHSNNIYQHRDYGLMPNTIYYYRIKAISRNGDYKYSNILNTNISNVIQHSKLYPNPVVNDAHIDCFINESTSTLIQIVNINGTIVWSKNTELVKGRNVLTIPMGNIAKGNYYLIIKGDNVHMNQSFIKL